MGPLPSPGGGRDRIFNGVEQLPGVDSSDLNPLWVDFYEIIPEESRKSLSRHLVATANASVKLLGEFYPLWDHGVAIFESIEIMMLTSVLILPDNIAFPVHLAERGVVSTKAGDVLLKG